MHYVFAPFIWLLGVLFSILLWVITQLLWIVLWLLLPILVVAFIALRVAERVLGQEKVRAWVKARTAKYGSAASIRARRLLFALGVAPVRVLFWFVIYVDLALDRQPVVATEVDAVGSGLGETLARQATDLKFGSHIN